MKFDELDDKMRVFETAHDLCVLPGIYMVARLDGRSFTRLTKEDAHRNALNAHGYWLLRKQGKAVGEATAAMSGLSVAQKNELLFQNGVNFNDLPLWQKRGSGLYWEEYERPAENPVTGEKVTARRRRVRRDLELPMKDDYSAFLQTLIS